MRATTLIFYHIYQYKFPSLSYSSCFSHQLCDWRMSRIRNYSQHRWTRIISSASRFAWILIASLKSEEVEEIDWHAKIWKITLGNRKERFESVLRVGNAIRMRKRKRNASRDCARNIIIGALFDMLFDVSLITLSKLKYVTQVRYPN